MMKKIILGNEYYVTTQGWGAPVKFGKAVQKVGDNHIEMQGIRPDTYGTFGAHTDMLFETREEALEHWQLINRKIRAQYLSEIQSVDDLCTFALQHNISGCGEYGDDNAREAYIIRSQELLGVKLKGLEYEIQNIKY